MTARCDRCRAPKGMQAVGEKCNNNCGGTVIAVNDTEESFEFIFETQHTEDGKPLVRYTPWTDGRVVGFRVEEIKTGRVEFLYLNPSDNLDGEDVPNAFLYHGEKGDPAYDTPYHHYTLFDA